MSAIFEVPTDTAAQKALLAILTKLLRKGCVLSVCVDGSLRISDPKAEARKARQSVKNRRKYARRRRQKVGVNVGESGVKRGESGDEFHGLTYRDMPGKNKGKTARQLNLALLRKGRLKGYESCNGLTGEAFRAEFKRIYEQRSKQGLQHSPSRT